MERIRDVFVRTRRALDPVCSNRNIKDSWRKFNSDIREEDRERYINNESIALYGPFNEPFIVEDAIGRKPEQIANLANNHAEALRQSPRIVDAGIIAEAERNLRRCGELPRVDSKPLPQ